jgi:hypothetical protein
MRSEVEIEFQTDKRNKRRKIPQKYIERKYISTKK